MSQYPEEAPFDASVLVDKLLSAGKTYVERGQAIAEEKLNIPEQGEQREVMLDGLKKGAMATAVLLGLLGTNGGRKLTGSMLKLGGLAALGTAAYKGYQNWQQTGDLMGVTVHSAEGFVDQPERHASEPRGLLIIEALVAAANADGNIDDQEQQAIKHQILEMHLPGEMAIMLENIIDSPLSAGELAQKVRGLTEASEVYLATRLLIGNDASLTETLYKDSLVSALGLSPQLISSLDSQT